jgi:predicted O-methyltransferase YrrM
MSRDTWTAVDDYFEGHLLPEDPVLEATLADSVAAGLPEIAVSPSQGRMLQLLARMHGATSILELGTLGGYSTIWLARALPEGGHLLTLEYEPLHAEIARCNLERARLSDNVEVRVGPALESLDAMIEGGEGPYDFVFIDADKPNNPHYLEWALTLSRPGSVIVADNVIRDGAVIDRNSSDANVRGIRRFNELVAENPRLSATAIQTVGSKGYDGFAIAVVAHRSITD